MSPPSIPPTPPNTVTHEEALEFGYSGIRTDPAPDEFYDCRGGVAPPQLTACQPTVGAAEGGTLLNLGGSGLSGALLVSVGQQPATEITVIDDSRVTCKTPAGEGTGLSVTLMDASGQASLAGIFSYTPATDG